MYTMKRAFLALLLAVLCLSVCAKQKTAKPTQKALSADSLVTLGREQYQAQHYLDALDLLGRAMNQADREGNDSSYVSAQIAIGNIYMLFSDYEQALHFYSTCLERAKATGQTAIIGKLYYNMLTCNAKLGRRQEAEHCYKQFVAYGIDGQNGEQFRSYVAQATLASARRYYKGAIYFHTQALRFAQTHDMQPIYVAAEMGKIAEAHADAGDLEAAEQGYLDCYDYAQKHHCVGALTTTCERLAAIYEQQGRDQLYMKYNRLCARYTDSLFQQQKFYANRSRVNDYESQIQERHLADLRAKNRTLLFVILTIATLMASLAALLIYIYKVNRRLVATQRLLIQRQQDHSRQLEVQDEIFSRISSAAPVSHATDDIASVSSASAAAPDSVSAPIASTAESLSAADPTTEVTPSTSDDSASDTDAASAAATDLLPKHQADRLLMAIAHVMEDNDTVCNPNFSLAQLAQMVDSNTKYVSWVINKCYGKNFKTYLNEYRIRIASQLLIDTSLLGNLTIAAIAEQVGYKSPASFHQAFKKIYAMTPAAYVKIARQREQWEEGEK